MESDWEAQAADVSISEHIMNNTRRVVKIFGRSGTMGGGSPRHESLAWLGNCRFDAHRIGAFGSV